mgnify:CR=1 FL=1
MISKFAKALAEKERVFTVEFPVIDGGDISTVKSRVDELKPWFDAANATDNPEIGRAHV